MQFLHVSFGFGHCNGSADCLLHVEHEKLLNVAESEIEENTCFSYFLTMEKLKVENFWVIK